MIRIGFPYIEISRSVPGPCHRVWDLLVDTERWKEWGPSVAAVSCSDRRIRNGSTGWVETPLGLRVPFRVTEYEEGRFWAWTTCGIPATGHRVDNQEEGGCRLTFAIPTVAAPYALICQAAAARIDAMLK